MVRERRSRLELVQCECVALIDDINGIASHINSNKQELLSPSMSSGTASQKTPLTPTAPGPKSTVIPDDIADALSHQHRSIQPLGANEILLQQRELIARQDEQLAAITGVAVRNKDIAMAIRDEVREHNIMLQDVSGQAVEAKSKLNVAQSRVKKI